jgi:hypothetical protein
MYAQDPHTISQAGVLAQWGYSEVINSHSEDCYADVPNINEIRKKRESGMPCSELTEDERRALATAMRELSACLDKLPRGHNEISAESD